MAKAIKKELTPKQERFCREYQLTYWTDAATAYRKAYKTSNNTSLSTSRVNSAKLLKQPHIQDHIRNLKKISAKRALVTLDSIIARLDASIKRSEKLEHERSVQQGLMNLASLQGQISGEKNTFSYKESKTLQDTIDVLNEAQEDYSQNLISQRQFAEVRATQKQIADAIEKQQIEELAEQVKSIQEKMDK